MEIFSYAVKSDGYAAIAVPVKETDHELQKYYEPLHHYEFSEYSLIKLMEKYEFYPIKSRILKDESRIKQIQALFMKQADRVQSR